MSLRSAEKLCGCSEQPEIASKSDVDLSQEDRWMERARNSEESEDRAVKIPLSEEVLMPRSQHEVNQVANDHEEVRERQTTRIRG